MRSSQTELRMPGPIHQFLAADHSRLNDLLDRATRDSDNPGNDLYKTFRSGLLRHIGMEEHILMPELRKARSGASIPTVDKLRLDHSALAAVLVPPPSKGILAAIQAILSQHNPSEENPGGLYEACDQFLANNIDAVLERLRSAAYPRLRPNSADPRAFKAARLLLARAGYDLDERTLRSLNH